MGEVNAERVETFLPMLHRDVVNLLNKAVELDWRDPDAGPRLTFSSDPRRSVNRDLIQLRTQAEHARTHAALVAHFLGALPPETQTEVVDAILEWTATKLAEEGEMLAADLLRDSDLRYDAHVEFSGEEPRGAGDDPYGRPDPKTHPEYWTE
jgi:hypothetical protein